MESSGQKGLDAEERLSAYFFDAGYYVARGVILVEGTLEITDVDLWIYHRSSVIHRTRANVDVKSKVRAKALERILWAKGMQQVLGLDEAIVATSDKRPEVKAFAQRNHVRLLDGDFLSRLATRDVAKFLSEEELSRKLDADGMDRMRGAWKDRARRSRSRLLTSLDFDGCNFWLAEVGVFFRSYSVGERADAALRLAYLNLSYFCIGLDFRSRNIVFEPEEVRRAALLAGLRFGERNQRELEALIRTLAPGAEATLMNLAESGRETILADYYANNAATSGLFGIARKLERLAHLEQVPKPHELDAEVKAHIGLICDYHQILRERIFRS